MPEIDIVLLREDLVSFASNYAALKQGLLPQDPDDNSDEAKDENLDGEENVHPPSKSKELVKRSLAKTVFRVPSDCCSSTDYSQRKKLKGKND